MNLELEKGELSRKLLSFGLTDRQSSAVFASFESRNYSLSAQEFSAMLEKMGHGRSAIITLLRDLGAAERDLLDVFSSGRGNQAKGLPEVDIDLQEGPGIAGTVYGAAASRSHSGGKPKSNRR